VKVRGPILIVDDDPDIREIIEIALTAHGYSVVTARDGRECLQRVRGEERPALILLDLMMPDINGWTVCEQLAKDPALAKVPVVILTGNAEVRDERLGSFPIMRKPIELARLLSTIERYTRDPE
jgi:CheY-like chemotaxis protein